MKQAGGENLDKTGLSLMRRKSRIGVNIVQNASSGIRWNMRSFDGPSTPPSISTIHGMRWNTGSRVSSRVWVIV